MARNIQIDESKGLQPRLFYSAKLSFRIEGQIESFPDKKKLRIHHHQMSIARNVKQFSLRRRRKYQTYE